MAGFRGLSEKTKLYGRKCTKCRHRAHEGTFHGHHWYCATCRPVENHVPIHTENTVTEDRREAQEKRDREYWNMYRRSLGLS
jgi:hypothetical protein